MPDAQLTQPALGIVALRGTPAARDEADDRDTGRCQPRERVTVEPPQVRGKDHGACGASRGRGQQISHVDAPADDDHAEVLPLESRHEIGLPDGVGDCGQDGDVHEEAAVAGADGGEAVEDADGPAEGAERLPLPGTRTRSTAPC